MGRSEAKMSFKNASGHTLHLMSRTLAWQWLKMWLSFTVYMFCLVQPMAANSGYLVVSPSIYRAGSDEVITVTILEPSQPIYVEAKLFSKGGHLITQSGHEIFGKGTLRLKIPWDTSGRCTLKVCGNCLAPKDESSFAFYNSTVIMVERKGASAFIQMDKSIYKPEQDVRINIITVGPDTLPVNDKLHVYVLDPRGTRMIQWSDLKPHCCGLTNITYPISSQPLLGKWTVFVDFQGHTYNKTFEILKYVLPKFEVAIQAPSYIVDWTKCQKVIVRSRYTYGRDVTGDLSVSMSVHGSGYYKSFVSNKTSKIIKMMGAAAFNICVSDLLAGAAISPHFRGVLKVEAEVTTEDGSKVKATDSTCIVNKHLIDMEYTSDTRRHFKPGLPFTGKLLTYYPDGSPAVNVTVEVKAETTNRRVQFEANQFVSSDDGLVNFHLQALPRTTHTIWIEARVVSIDGRDVRKQYLPVYMAISGWYSPSDCHMMVEGPPHFLKVGDVAGFRVHSTCSCNFTLYHEVMARGNLVHSGIHFARHVQKRSIRFAQQDLITFEEDAFVAEEHDFLGMKTCTVGIKLQVSHQMAPFSRLVVYYVKENGEGVSDTLQFNVKPKFRNKVSIELSEREVLPGSHINMHVNTRPNSCVCIGGVDKSVHLLRPGYQISEDQIFDELENYDITTEEYPTKRKRSRRPRSLYYERQFTRSRDAHYAFEEAGLLVMTDSVSLHFKQRVFHSPPFPVQAQRSSQKESRLQQKLGRRTRSYFPETWLWTCFNTSSTRRESPLRIKVPDTITSWVVNGISINPNFGLALAQPVQVKTFKNFFLQFNTPYSVIRGEQIKIPLTIHNYLSHCAKIHLTLNLPEGVHYVPSRRTDLHRMCIGSEETKTISPVLVFGTVGIQNITAEAEAFADSMCCSGIISDETPRTRDKIGEDRLQHTVRTEPEGVKKGYTHSTFFCPNEQLHLMTPSIHEFQYMKKPERIEDMFTFSVQASNDVSIALSLLPQDNEDMYQIVLGGLDNRHSWISLGKHGEHLVNTSTEGVLSGMEYRTFWISWQKGHIKVGEVGDGNETLLLDVISNRPVVVKYIGFATAFGATGLFKIWTKADEDGKGYNEIFNLDLPPNIIPNSERATVSLIGDVMGPSLYKLGNLLQLPAGCGEQNMVNFAPNVYILRYLQHTGKLTEEITAKALDYMIRGYQRQMTYKREDGSYSAFGEKDDIGNMWLTSFVLKCFAQAREYIYIDEKELNSSIAWIVQHQRKDGSFPAIGRLINRDIQGGVQGKISLTAYVLVALVDALGREPSHYKFNLRAAKRFLEKSAKDITDPYTAALTSLALTRIHSEHAAPAVHILHEMAIVRDGFKYWKHFGSTNQEDILLFMHDPSQMKVSAADIEIASYALLTMIQMGEVSHSLPTVKWLSMQRNPHGGFYSTQDTVVALQALSEFAMASFGGGLNLSVNIAALGLEQEVNVIEGQSTTNILLPTLPTGLFTSASGHGCALIQVDVSYNVPDPTKAPSFEILVRIAKQRQKDRNRTEKQKAISLLSNDLSDEFKVTLEACTRWLHNGSSNMAVLEMSILTGFRPDLNSLEQLLQHRHLQLKRYEFDNTKVMFYFDEIRSGCLTCVSFEAVREYIVGKTQPVLVKIYDYYEPAYETTQFYNASHIGELSMDLCEDKECNEIKEDVQLPESEEDCNSIFGCYGKEEDQIEFCTCYRDCPPSTNLVCGSDGIMHENRCSMEVHACQNDMFLEVMPEGYCHPELIEDLSGEGSGDFDDTSGEGKLTTQHNIDNDNLPTLGFAFESASTVYPEENIGTIIPEQGEVLTTELMDNYENAILDENVITQVPNDTDYDMEYGNNVIKAIPELTNVSSGFDVPEATTFTNLEKDIESNRSISMEEDTSKESKMEYGNTTATVFVEDYNVTMDSTSNISPGFIGLVIDVDMTNDTQEKNDSLQIKEHLQDIIDDAQRVGGDAMNFTESQIEKFRQTQNKIKLDGENDTEQKIIATTQMSVENKSDHKFESSNEQDGSLREQLKDIIDTHQNDTLEKADELTTSLLFNIIPGDERGENPLDKTVEDESEEEEES